MSDVPLPPSQPAPRRMQARSYAMGRSIMALILREMSTRFGRSPGGYVWAILEPIGAIAVLSIVFSLLIRTPSLGNSFILFYASGYLPFIMFLNVSMNVQNALMFSKPLLMYPAVSWFDALLARFLLNFLTSVTVAIVVFIGILQIVEVNTIIDYRPVVLSMLLSALFGLGIGTFNCLAAGLYPVYGHLWGMLTRPLVLIAGVIFIYEDLPTFAQNILGMLPWIHLTGLFRTGVFPGYEPDYISLTLVLAWTLIPLAFGLLLLRRHHQDILMR